MALTVTAGYTWADGEVDTDTKRNLAGLPTIAADQTYTFSVGAAATPSVNFTGFTTAGLYYSGGVGVAVGATSVGLFTSTGLNATAIGATTPGAGAFTTLTCTTDLALTEGGTGASTAAGARSNLGVTATGADTTYSFRANNLSDLASATTARTNLGLGTAATQSTGTFAQVANNLSDVTASTARSNLGVTATGADTTYAFRANNLSDLPSAVTARANLGLFPSSTTSNFAGSFGISQAGTIGADLVFNTPGAPTVTLAAGTWLLNGSVTARTSDSDDEVSAQFYNNEEATAFGGGACYANQLQRGPLPVTAIVTVAGSRTIYFKVFRYGFNTLDVGTAGGPAGYITAQRLF